MIRLSSVFWLGKYKKSASRTHADTEKHHSYCMWSGRKSYLGNIYKEGMFFFRTLKPQKIYISRGKCVNDASVARVFLFGVPKWVFHMCFPPLLPVCTASRRKVTENTWPPHHYWCIFPCCPPLLFRSIGFSQSQGTQSAELASSIFLNERYSRFVTKANIIIHARLLRRLR